MRRLGLTGGIGSGKSTVGQMLVDCGATLIDADAISRATTAAGGLAIASIAARFGQQAINSDGAMDRDAMRDRVFASPSARRHLEAIIHPLVSVEIERQAAQAHASRDKLLVFDIPLLVESGRWREQLGRILVVDCEEALQVSRVVQRSNWTLEAVHKVMAQQASRAQRLGAADLVIYNQDITLTELAEHARQIALRMTL